LGSIGQRHVRNFRELLPDVEFIAYRAPRNDNRREPNSDFETAYAVRRHTKLDDALAERPSAALVCNPTSLHVPVAIAAARAGCHLLIEKPISHTKDGIDELQKVLAETGRSALLGFQFRFHPGLALIRQLINEGAIGPVVNFHVHWGEYLPAWHPWEDYRQSYSARAELGGGVILTLAHPFDYLHWMLGKIRRVSATLGNFGGLDIDVEDNAEIVLRFDSGIVGTVHLDYVQQPASHCLRVTGQAGTILWDNEAGIVRCYRADRGSWESVPPPHGFERNGLFFAEARHFLDCIAGRSEPQASMADGIHALDVALAAKQSAAERREISVSQ
jgi:predicted dehydrogenase